MTRKEGEKEDEERGGVVCHHRAPRTMEVDIEGVGWRGIVVATVVQLCVDEVGERGGPEDNDSKIIPC